MKKLQFIVVLIVFVGSIFNTRANNQTSQDALSNRAFCLTPNQETVLTATLGQRANEKSKIEWASSDPAIVSLSEANGQSVKIKAVTLGQSDVTLSLDGRLIGSCRVIVDNDGVVKILAIGNSFSEDAIEQNLYEIITSEGIPAVIGNMYIPGCSLERHLKNSQTDAPDYRYRKIVDGTMTTQEKTKLSEAIADEDWDFISLQQASHFSGIYSTYQRDLPPLLEYVKKTNKKEDTQYALHQTWAYAGNSDHDGFKNYNNDQVTMYRSIVDANAKASDLTGIAIVIPSGTAIQNERSGFVGDHLNRDGYHLDLHMGRYTAACTWADKLLGINILTNPYIPEQVTWDEILLARISARNAVRNPQEITVF